MITVTSEPSRQLIRARMGGMLTVAEIEAFGREEQAAVRAMGLGDREFDLLVETVGDLVQTQEAMGAFAHLIQNSPRKARRLAMVRAGVLTRMQTRRLSKLRSSAETFGTVAEAELWLDEERAEDARAGLEAGA